MIHETAIIHPGVMLGENAEVQAYAIVGNPDGSPVVIGANCRIGYHSIVRGHVRIGDNFTLGSMSSVEGDTIIGDDVTVRGKCEIPSARIGDRVQVYAYATFYDTPNPPDGPCVPPVIEDDVVLCCRSAVLGGVTVGAGSLIGAHVLVTKDVPAGSYVVQANEAIVRPRRS